MKSILLGQSQDFRHELFVKRFRTTELFERKTLQLAALGLGPGQDRLFIGDKNSDQRALK